MSAQCELNINKDLLPSRVHLHRTNSGEWELLQMHDDEFPHGKTHVKNKTKQKTNKIVTQMYCLIYFMTC